MATEPTLDFDLLLSPISPEVPGGINLRQDEAGGELFHDVLGARRAAREAEKLLYRDSIAGEEEGAPKIEKPDWNAVITLATGVLGQHSKDLWVSAWLVEALVREHGFAGLRDGLRLIRELSERYWDGIQPQPDEDNDAGHVVSQVDGLNRSLESPIHAIAITGGSTGPFTGLDYIAAFELGQEGGVSKSEFDSAVKTTPDDFYRELFEDVSQCEEELSGMIDVLNEKCGTNSPSLTALKETLENSTHRIKSIAPHVVEEPASDGEEASVGGEMVSKSEAAIGDGQVATRDEAFRLLGRIAEFFERTEPHSPVSYGLRQVVRWGRMSLPDLLAELISDESARGEMFRRTGIPEPSVDENSD